MKLMKLAFVDAEIDLLQRMHRSVIGLKDQIE